MDVLSATNKVVIVSSTEKASGVKGGCKGLKYSSKTLEIPFSSEYWSCIRYPYIPKSVYHANDVHILPV